MPEPEQQRYQSLEFGPFDLNQRSGELRKYGVKIKLQDQPLQILSLLLERPGELVTREEIQKRLWPENTYVDFENAINTGIRKLRDALGDRPGDPRYIETRARHGYRFIAEVCRPTSVLSIAPLETSVSRVDKQQRWRAITFVTVAFAITAFGLVWWITVSRRGRGEGPAPPVPLTTYPGVERFPSFSPEGTRVAFTWGEPGKPSNIYVKMIGPGEPLRLTTDPGDFAPAWSPDGSWIAFLRGRDEFHASVIVTPAVGGQERELARIQFPAGEYLGYGDMVVPPPFLAWSGDSKSLLALDGSPSRARVTLRAVRVSVDTGEMRTLTSPPHDIFGDGSLAISPDGRTLAFTRTVTLGVRDIYTVRLSKELLPVGEPQRITYDNKQISGLAWTGDGRKLVFASYRGGRQALWEIAPHSGDNPVQAASVGDDPADIAISHQKTRLVYSHLAGGDGDIWRIGLSGAEAGRQAPLVASTRFDSQPQYSPDGKRIVFLSVRSGTYEIWIANDDGSNPRQLTFLGWSGSPRWSPDGQKIAFDSNVEGNWNIYIVNSQGGKPLRLTSHGAGDYRPSWSRDGKWIYFGSNRTGTSQIWKMPSAGGQEIQLTRSGGFAAFESEDGSTLYFNSQPNSGNGLWKMAVTGGDETKIWDSLDGCSFSPGKRGVYIFDSRGNLKLLDSNGNILQTIAGLPGAAGMEIGVSPDERWLLYTKRERFNRELMLVENFR